MFMCDKREEYKVDRHVQILTVFCCMSLCIIKALCVLLSVLVSKNVPVPRLRASSV